MNARLNGQLIGYESGNSTHGRLQPCDCDAVVELASVDDPTLDEPSFMD